MKIIDIAYKEVQGLFSRKKVVTTQAERDALKRKYSGRGDIKIVESVPAAKKADNRNWIDEIEDFDAFMS